MIVAPQIGLVRQINQPGLKWAVAPFGSDFDLYDSEADAVSRAVPGRVAEFNAGRVAARRALAQLGIPKTPIPMGPDRAPIWPKGLCGSISHSNGFAIAVVTDQPRVLGVDLEVDQPMDPALIDQICRVDDVGEPVLVFSAKEAVYKALYPHTKTVFGFHAMRMDLPNGRAFLPDHPETAAIAPHFKAENWTVFQARGGGVILSLCAQRFVNDA